MRNLRIGARISLGFAGVLLSTVVLAAVALFSNFMSAGNAENIRQLSTLQEEGNTFVYTFGNAQNDASIMFGEWEEDAEDAFGRLAAGYDSMGASLSRLAALTQEYDALADYGPAVASVQVLISEWMRSIRAAEASIHRIGDLYDEFLRLDALAVDAIVRVYQDQSESWQNDIDAGADEAAMARRRSRIDHAASLKFQLSDMRPLLFAMFNSYDLSDVEQVAAIHGALMASLEQFIANTTQERNLPPPQQALAALYSSSLNVTALVGTLREHYELVNATREYAAVAGDIIHEMKGQIDDDVRAAIDSSRSVARAALTVSIIFAASSIGVGILCSVLIGRAATRPLKASAAALQDIGEKLGAAVSQVNDSASAIAEASNEQAASVEQTSATISETSAMIASNTENTGIATRIALETEQSTTSSEQSMAELLEAMAELKESSNTVSKIVRTIDDIAFQTNLLAINATVEAARAGGDAGRSFGVVAEEVRNLALRSAQSAADTAEMIQKNIALTNTSRASAEKMLKMAQDDAENARKLSKLIEEIAAASEEQASGAEQISAAMGQIEKSTQSNAATSQESAASAAMLKELMAELERIYNDVNTLVYGGG